MTRPQSGEKADDKELEELRRQYRVCKAILSTTPDFAYVFDRDHRFIYANEALLQAWGLSLDEATGKNCLELGYEPWHAEMHDREIDQVLATGAPVRGEVPFEGTGGRRIYDYIFTPVFGPDGEVDAVVGTTRDITERKYGEDRQQLLAEAGRILGSSLEYESTLAMVCKLVVPQFADWCALDLFTQDRQIRHIEVAHKDPAKIELAHELRRRFPPQESDKGGLMEMMRTGRPRLYSEITDEMLVQGARSPEHLEMMRQLGLKSLIMVPLIAREQTMGAMTLVSAESSRRYAEKDLQLALELASRAALAADNAKLFSETRALYEELKLNDRRKDEFLAILAHELRNPLAPISNAVHLFHSASVKEPVRNEALKLVNRQITHITHLLDDLLDVSRITRGKIELRLKPMDLTDAITMAVEATEPFMSERRHRLDIQLPSSPLPVSGDITRLSQIFTNLLNNAAKYTNQQGRIEIKACIQGSEVVVSVKDNGIGIPKHMLRSVFDMFAQVDSSMERSFGGLGIGLTLVKDIIEMHHGSVVALSGGQGEGSEFIVRLALLEQSGEGGRTLTPVYEEVAVEALSVLVVDDNDASAKTMGWMLEMLGHQVRLAGDGPEAIAIAGVFLPNVVLLDIGLPGMNGYEVCKELRRIPALEHTTLIAQTGWGQKEHIQQSKDAGFDYHLVKPVKMEELQHILAVRHASKQK